MQYTPTNSKNMRPIIEQLKLVYYAFYVLAVALATIAFVVVGRDGNEFFEPHSAEAIVKTIYILFLICSIPVVLKLFNVKVKKLAEVNLPEEEKFAKYRNYSFWRLVVIGVNMLIGIALFYVLQLDQMLFCAAIAAIALVFCKPSEQKMETELGLDKDDEEE